MAQSQLKMNGPAPQWKNVAVVKNEFKEICLDDYKDKYLVFFFYPLDL
jgi:alkyl hydroperoxide reductase subunit AhpC